MAHVTNQQQERRDAGWQFWIDRGGTFTDVVARRPDGGIVTLKLLSENPRRYADAAVEGIRRVLGAQDTAALREQPIDAVKMGTTVATNALLERTGEPTLLVITQGFADALRIGYQQRPDLFALQIELPEMLYSQVIEARERIGPQGAILQPLDSGHLRAQLQDAYAQGLRSVAIVFMHAYRYPQHEREAARLAREIGFQQVSASHDVSPLMKIVSRGDTTVVDAYLSPILRRYVDQVAGHLGDTRLMFMQSNGGLTDAHYFQGKDAILSGPAGGVVGLVETAQRAGFEKLIGFDMGGTSTDVSHFDGEYERAFETLVAGVRLRAPMMLIHTVAAGGGSILHFDGSRFRVGPDSAGANPGPACYRNGGPLTVTDCNVMLGKLNARFFPHVFGAGADQPLDEEIVADKFDELTERISQATGRSRTREDVAAGFLSIAIENMANAIKKISVQRGYDVTEYTLCSFGGAGGQHACLVADALGIKRVFIHKHAGVLSAYGMGLADLRVMRDKAVEDTLSNQLMVHLENVYAELERDGVAQMQAQIVPGQNIRVQRKLRLRYAGSDTALLADYAAHERIVAAFEYVHRQRYGFVADKPIVVEALQVEVIGVQPQVHESLPASQHASAAPLATTHAIMAGERCEVGVYRRDDLPRGDNVQGPAIVIEDNSTIVIEPGWQATYTHNRDLVLERTVALPQRVAIGTDVDPVMLEIFNNLFMNIAEQMGTVLEKTAVSVNIKERLDFSCAIFDQDGELIANAPHMPVHLGSMSESIKTVIRDNAGDIHPGDVFMLNAPYNGGTHLPDVTVVKPVFEARKLLFYVASRGHHADIGGITPGSMPPDSTSVEQDGVLFDNVKIVDGGKFLETQIRQRLSEGAYPARNPQQNVADFQAQIAACEKGVQELLRMVGYFGLAVVHAYMQHVKDNAEESVRRVLDALQDGSFQYAMDDGSRICVSISVDKQARTARIDFSGTSPQQAGNYNAPVAVSTAAVLYVFRCMVAADIPLNAGCLKPIEIVIPAGSMLNPQYPAAVVAGNVETSQYVVDTLFGAMGVAGASQGTMNNFTFGNDEYQYYETICGGSGATEQHAGTDAVHTHMTNSRLTDPEILEWRFPVLLEQFAIRENSGGAGRRRGGNGTVRRVRFLQAMTASILAGHRKVPPYGMRGGEPGAVGRNWVEHEDGTRIELAAQGKAELRPGDVFVVLTPGGGGFGVPE
jgi:5-oxoprolinase (ATP-hydrolysing)